VSRCIRRIETRAKERRFYSARKQKTRVAFGWLWRLCGGTWRASTGVGGISQDPRKAKDPSNLWGRSVAGRSRLLERYDSRNAVLTRENAGRCRTQVVQLSGPELGQESLH
jgi:hypothetical protein